MNETYKKAIAAAKSRMLDCIQRKHAIETEITRLANIIAANAQMLSDSEKEAELKELKSLSGFAAEEPVLTDAVRVTFKLNPNAEMTAKSIRDLLKSSAFPLQRYSQPLARIDSILRKLHKKREIGRRLKDGDAYYFRAS
jgi:hypothetical protein